MTRDDLVATDERWQALLSGQWVFVEDVRLLVTRVDDAMTMTVSGHVVPGAEGGMSRDELIEAMAQSYGKHVDHVQGKPCATCQRIARAMAPAVVAFVAEWLEVQWGLTSMEMARAWREDMRE